MRRLVGLALLVAATGADAADKVPPYWASIASGEAMIRTGPGRNYPGTWLYKRRDLPVRVVKIYSNWRLIEDPDGTRGWMLVTLLSDRRTALVKPGQPRPIRVGPYDSAKPEFMAEQGVVGTREAQIHDVRLEVDRNLERAREREARALRGHAVASDGPASAQRRDRDVWRDTYDSEPIVRRRCDDPRDRSAVHLAAARRRSRVDEIARDSDAAVQIRM